MAFPIISDFVDAVRFNLGNRQDLNDRISNWLKLAYRELAMGYPFETLEATVIQATSQGVDTYSYPDDARAIKSLMLMNQNQPVPIVKKDIRVVRRYQVIGQGVPAVWAPFGSEIIMRPVPNSSYPLYIDYWQKPTIAANEADVPTINACEVQLPDDWFEILIQSATQKGHLDLQEADKAAAVRQSLNGDPNPAKGWPGMIKEHLKRDAAENALSNYGLRPRMRRYTSTK